MNRDGTEVAWVGLGSNLDDPGAQVSAALGWLASSEGVTGVTGSALYRNPPMGPSTQPDFVNAVARVVTRLAPFELLDTLQAIEAAHGRDRAGPRWGPRTIDLDLLLYGTRAIDDRRLRVPHPGIVQRAFVIHPLAELGPDLCIPGQGRAATLAEGISREQLTRLTGPGEAHHG